jgi:hypothetical protein
MFIALYRVIAFCVVCGVIIALAVIICAAAVVSVLAAVVYGLASRKRTVRSSLQVLALNVAATVNLMAALRP